MKVRGVGGRGTEYEVKCKVEEGETNVLDGNELHVFLVQKAHDVGQTRVLLLVVRPVQVPVRYHMFTFSYSTCLFGF